MLRVMTLNLLAPDQAGWDRRRPVLRAGLAELRPQLIALQEVADPADVLGDGYHVAAHSRRSADGVGAVLASVWPLGEVSEIDLRVTDRVDVPWCAAVVAKVLAPPPLGPLLFVHHKPTWQAGYAYERELQAVACARFVEEQLAGRRMHVVLAGDFDDGPDAAALRFWTGRQSLRDYSVAYLDAWEAARPGEPGHTFTPANPLVRAGEMPLERGRRIDHVLVRCGPHGPTLDVAGCRLAFDEPVDGVWAGDHFGVVADLTVPDRPPCSGWR